MSKLAVRDLTPSTLEVATEQVVGGYYYDNYNYQYENNFNQQNSSLYQYNSTFVFDNSYRYGY